MFHRFSTLVWFLAFFCAALFAVFSFRFFDVQAAETPKAVFLASPLVGKDPLTVRFSDMSSASDDEDISDWTWTFGDGTLSKEHNPSHTFGVGTYTISLTVTDSGGKSDSATKVNYIIVSEAAADFTVGSVNPVSAQEGVAPTPKFYTEVSVGGSESVKSCALHVDGVSQGGMVNKATGRFFTIDACAPGNTCVAEHPTYRFLAGSAGTHSAFVRCASDSATADGTSVSIIVSLADGGGDGGGDGGAPDGKKCDEKDEVGAGVIRFRNPLCVDSFEGLLDTLLNFIFWIATALTPVLVLLAAFHFLTAAGSPDKIKKARDILLWTIIGYGVIVLSKGIVAVFKEIFGISGS